MPEPLRPIMPIGPASAYQTYSIRAGNDTTVVAACKDVGCQAWAHGWESTFDEATDLGRAQAAYVRTKSGRTFTERRTGAGLTVFRFEPFQRCFAEHRTRPDSFWVRDGDFRGNPTGWARRHTGAADWIEDFQEHEGLLADERQKG
jgi:hypothetical protein